MIISIHQPQYLPWLGFFDKIDKADIFVILDDVQYKKNEWQNRNKIRSARGWQWITVPVKYSFGQRINQIKIDNTRNWKEEHYKSLVTNYSKAPYFKDYKVFFEKAFMNSWDFLVDLNIYFIEYSVKSLNITTKLLKASQLKLEGQSTEKLVNICKELGADTYLSGKGGREYLDLGKFKSAGIEVKFQDFIHPVYKQVYNNFESFMSVIDLLFNYGDKSLDVLRGENIQ